MLAAAGNDPTLYAKHLPLHLRVQVVCNHLEGGDGGDDQDSSDQMVGQMPNFKSYREDMERRYLQDLMTTTDRNIPKAVEISKISRSRLYEMLAKHNVQLVADSGAELLVTSCAECMRTWKVDYEPFFNGKPPEIVTSASSWASA